MLYVIFQHHFLKISVTSAITFPGAKKKIGKLSDLLLLNMETNSKYIYFFTKTYVNVNVGPILIQKADKNMSMSFFH